MMSTADLSVFSTLFKQKKSIVRWSSKVYKTEKPASCFEVSPDGNSYAIGGTDGDLVIIRQMENNELVSSDFHKRHDARITDIAFNPTANLMATCSNEPNVCITSFRTETSKIGTRGMKMKMTDPVRALQFVEDYASGANILISAVGRRICITDCSSGTTFKEFIGHTAAVTALCMWGGCMFASSSTDKTIRIWDMRVKESVKLFNPLPKPAAIGSTTFQVDSNGRLLFRGDGQGVIHVYDVNTNKKVTSKQLLNSSATCLRLSRSKRFLLAADQSSINLCDFSDVCNVSSPCQAATTAAKVQVARWHPCSPNFITLDAQAGLRLWDLQVEEPKLNNNSDTQLNHNSSPAEL